MKLRNNSRSLRWLIGLSAIAVAAAAGVWLSLGVPSQVPPTAPAFSDPALADRIGGHLDTGRLINGADRIVVGQIGEGDSRWEGGRIVTDVRVDVSETVKGERAQSITVTVPGGSIGGIGMRSSLAPSMTPGEKSLLFLRRAGDTHVVYGLRAGKWPVGSNNGDETVQWRSPRSSTSQPRSLRDVVDEISRFSPSAP